MDGPVQVEHDAFMAVMNTRRLQSMQIIFLAMLGGVLMFGLVLGLMRYQRGEAPQPAAAEGLSLLGALTVVHAVMAALGFPAAYAVYHWLAGPRGAAIFDKNPATRHQSGELKCVLAIYTGTIIRMAIVEGIALFGYIACLIGIHSGELDASPLYWGNLFSPVVFVLMIAATFPTRGRMESLFLRRFCGQTAVGVR